MIKGLYPSCGLWKVNLLVLKVSQYQLVLLLGLTLCEFYDLLYNAITCIFCTVISYQVFFKYNLATLELQNKLVEGFNNTCYKCYICNIILSFYYSILHYRLYIYIIGY